MKQFLFKSVIAAVAGVMLMASAPTMAQAADVYLAVKAKPGLTLFFGAHGGSKNSSTVLFKTNGNGVTKQNNGWYVQKLPSGFDVSQMKKWCAIVIAPMDYFDQGKCTGWGNQEIPQDGIFKMTLNL